MAAEKGIVLGFETMETPFMDTVEKAMRYVNLVSSPYLGVYPDIGNLKNCIFIIWCRCRRRFDVWKRTYFCESFKRNCSR